MKHKMAIIGYGGMGHWHYEKIQEELSELVVKGVFDVRQTQLDKALSENLHAYTSLQELLDDEEIELVTIATPNDVHAELLISCMRAGKHVISEKPVTMNAKELEAVIAVSKETNRIFSIHQNRRWDRDYKIIKHIVQDNVLGKPYFIKSRVQGSRGSMHGWRGHKVNGGGMLLDWGVHLIDQLLDMMDAKVISVDAHLLNLFSDEVDDNIRVHLRFDNGVCATLEMVTNCLINESRWHLSCLDGTAVIQDWSCDGKMVQLKQNADLTWDDDIVYTEAGPTRTMAPRPSYTINELPLPEVQTSWSDYYKNIIAVIENKADLIVKPEQALRVMTVIDLAFKSYEEKQGLTCQI